MKYVSKDQNDPHRYDDLLNMERPLSQHKALSMAQRAAQFASFDALDGYKDTIQENGRITVEQIELSDDEKQIIDTKLQALKENISSHPYVTITYFVQKQKIFCFCFIGMAGMSCALLHMNSYLM